MLIKKLIENLNDNDLKLYSEEISSFLPERIIDSHVHLWKEEFFKQKIQKNRINQNPALDTEIINGLTIEDFKSVAKKIFPNKTYDGFFFGLPIREIDLDKNNEYISSICIENNSYGLFIPKPGLEEIPQDFFKNRFIGFKPYPDLVFARSGRDGDVSIFDFVSSKVLEFCQENGLILLLHIPRADRLNDKKNIEEIKTIGKRYPKIKIILAHAGRSYCYSDIKNSIKYLKDIDNLYIDTAMINNFLVNKVLLEELGSEKILYGSDLPIALFKGKNIDINNNHYFVTSSPRPWSLSSEIKNLSNFTFFIYEIIKAIKFTIDELNISSEQIKQIFLSNAQNMISDINTESKSRHH